MVQWKGMKWGTAENSVYEADKGPGKLHTMHIVNSTANWDILVWSAWNNMTNGLDCKIMDREWRHKFDKPPQ